MASQLALWLAVGAVALAGLLFGFDTAVISGVTAALRDTYALDPAQIGWTVSSALWGTLVGAGVAGLYGDRVGARFGLRLSAAFYIASGLGCAFAPDWATLLAARVLCGVAIGASSVLAPIYLAEIAPAAQRGRLVGMFQVNIVVGIVVAYASNLAVGAAQLGADEWRWKLGLTTLPAVLFFVMLLRVPNSPRWLAARGRSEEARAAFAALGSTETPQPTVAAPRASLAEIWRTARTPVLLVITLAAFNQLTGINAILYYLTDIFAAAGFGKLSADLQSIAVGLTNLTFTLIAMTVIDRLGRRRMLLIGSVGMAAALGVAAGVMYDALPKAWLLGVLIVFIAFFAFSQGAVIWVYLSEVFPTRVRAAGQAIGAGTIWLFDALVAQIYPVIAAQSKGLPFVIFLGVMVVQGVVVWRFFPETKGASLEEVERRLGTRV